ncbi:hypothetical protein MTO96_020584 [Rhipicephalus appendiculatus]
MTPKTSHTRSSSKLEEVVRWLKLERTFHKYGEIEGQQNDQIIVGSHSGVLRVYQPTCAQTEDGTFENFRPQHMLLEFQMAQAILHVLLGQFVSASDKLFIATLHPQRISVHNLAGDAGEAEPGTQYKLSLMYEHTLSAPSYCCVAGHFGGVKGQDFLCVQGVDGSLTFFEQENFAFTRYLPEFLLPGPLAYVAKTDSLVTVNTAFHLENFSDGRQLDAAHGHAEEHAARVPRHRSQVGCPALVGSDCAGEDDDTVSLVVSLYCARHLRWRLAPAGEPRLRQPGTTASLTFFPGGWPDLRFGDARLCRYR